MKDQFICTVTPAKVTLHMNRGEPSFDQFDC